MQFHEAGVAGGDDREWAGEPIGGQDAFPNRIGFTARETAQCVIVAPGGAGGDAETAGNSYGTWPGRIRKLANRAAGPVPGVPAGMNPRTATKPARASRASRGTTMTGVAMSPRKSAARAPSSTTRTGVHCPGSNATDAVPPGP